MIAVVNWDQVSAIAAAAVVVVYPPLGVIWRWIRHTETRFDEIQEGINTLKSSDTVDVAALQAFRDDMGRRVERLENYVWKD